MGGKASRRRSRSASYSSWFSPGMRRKGKREYMPCLKLLRQVMALPSGVFGPPTPSRFFFKSLFSRPGLFGRCAFGCLVFGVLVVGGAEASGVPVSGTSVASEVLLG